MPKTNFEQNHCELLPVKGWINRIFEENITMSDIIRLLPDSIANQIAAGEVIQRPASAVKELLENAVDAGATRIQLILREAGRSQIQVIDNGMGMSDTDARMSFERHATSKLRSAEDLFMIRTKGFRGEALASIAAIAQVEMKTRKRGSELGTCILIEGSEVKSQEASQCPEGTNISVKNLFFNVPARRNFLKSDQVEFRHIVDEFHRVALAHPGIVFSLHHNNQENFHLEAGGLRQRILSIFGQGHNERLVPVDEVTTIVSVTGFISKPEFARKTRGEQFFFVNNRFIRNPYLHHAVQAAFQELIPQDSFVSYFLFLELDPSRIDVNIHPTKTEVKFEEENNIYTILRSAVKRSLGKYNVTPTLDFEQETSFNFPAPSVNKPVVIPVIKVNPDFNPFQSRNSPIDKPGTESRKESSVYNPQSSIHNQQSPEKELNSGNQELRTNLIQVNNKYIVTSIKSGLMIIDQQLAHERILYERHLKEIAMQKGRSQQLLFPQHFEVTPEDYLLAQEIMNELRNTGFDLNDIGKNTYILHGIPVGMQESEAVMILESILDDFKHSGSHSGREVYEPIARSISKVMAIKNGKRLTNEEMQTLVDELFACEAPMVSPSGKHVVITINSDELEKKFK